jgi:translocation protein SEC63
LSRVYTVLSASDKDIGAVSRTSAEKRKADQLKKETKSQLFASRGFAINLGVTITCSLLFVWLLWKVSTDEGQVNSFDPFAILNIDSAADSKLIKKAYRRLSLMYHPDKNPGDRAAAAKFIMVKKAYESLTDETSKENWEKYGNPDGKQSLEVSIGLPAFLLDTNYRNLVLVAYLVIMVVLFPLVVWLYYSDSSQYGEKDVMYDTYSWFHNALEEHMPVKSLPEVMAGAKEFRQRNKPASAAEKKEIADLMQKELKSSMVKPKYNHPVVVKGNALLHAHLLRKTHLLSPQLQDDLKFMLRRSNSLMDAMISICKQQDWMDSVVSCIDFGQLMAQAMWSKDSPLLQIPHFTPDEIKHCENGKTKVTSIKQFKELPADDRKGMVNFTDAQKKDVLQYLEIFPDVSVETKTYTDDDEDPTIYEGDLVTVEVTITRNNLLAGEKAGLVHAPFFPFPKKEAWWIILGQVHAGKIVSIEQVSNPNRTVVHKIKFMAPPKGSYVFDLLVKSNAYVGCDVQTKVEMDCKDASVLPEYKVHAEDAELDDEPTLFEEMLNANIERDSDDEDSDDENDADDDGVGNKDKSAADKKKEQLRKARQEDDDDDDSDDE